MGGRGVRRDGSRRRAADDCAAAQAGCARRPCRPVVAFGADTARRRGADRRRPGRGRADSAGRRRRAPGVRGCDRLLRPARPPRRPARPAGGFPSHAPGGRGIRGRGGACLPAGAAGLRARHRGRGGGGVAGRLRQRLQLHGRRERHLRRPRTDRRGGLRVPRRMAAGRIRRRLGSGARGRRVCLPALERRPCPGLPR